MNTHSDVLLDIRNLTKRFSRVVAVDDVSLQIGSGEIFALLGPSGCGKSTLLRMIAGLELPDSGEILLDNASIAKIPANKRPINMVFQSYAVFPHMTVENNVAYGLKARRVASTEINQKVEQALAQVHLLEQRDRKPHQLSGGQRQRVALARALVMQPRVLLLDEPLSALDAKLRDQMRLELVKLQESVGVTFIIVTHDQNEAMAMSDRIAVLDQGRVRQIASPEELYHRPVDTFVADFIGKINLFDVRTVTVEGNTVLAESADFGLIEIHDVTDTTRQLLNNSQPVGWKLGLRPEKLKIVANGFLPAADTVSLSGHVGDVAFQGVNSEIEIRLNSDRSLSAIASADDLQYLRQQASGSIVDCVIKCSDFLLLPESED